MKTTKGFVFDLDGTLVDSMGPALKAFQWVVKQYTDKPFTEADIEIIRHRSNHNLFAGWVPEADLTDAVEKLVQYNLKNLSEIQKVPHIVTLLETLTENGFPLAVWTGRDFESAQKILSHNNLLPFFTRVVGNCNVKKNKPDPEGLLLASQDFSFAPHNITHVGDHFHDVQGARSAGCSVIGVHWCSETSSQPTEHNDNEGEFCKWLGHKPDHEFECPLDFNRWIKES